MSHRTGITNALAAKMSEDITGSRAYNNGGGATIGQKGYRSDLSSLVSTRFTYLDEINEFPYVSVSPGFEDREDHPADFSWAFLTVMVRIFVHSEDAAEEQLELIISDIETFVDRNRILPYTIELPNPSSGELENVDYSTTDIVVRSITTDEGLLRPTGIGEVVLDVRYAKNRTI